MNCNQSKMAGSWPRISACTFHDVTDFEASAASAKRWAHGLEIALAHFMMQQ